MKPHDIREANTAKLRLVAERMGRLRDDVVFFGGTVIPFLLTQPISLNVRPSKDVDLITDFSSDRDLYKFEDALWERGFKKKRTGPVCQWVVEGIRVDAVIAEPVLGIDNAWCAEAVARARRVDIGNGMMVSIVPASCFVGVKLAAFHRRGTRDDYARSRDIYDVLLVIAGCPEIEEEILEQASPELWAYLCSELEKLLEKSSDLYELVPRYSRDDQALEPLLSEVVSRIERIMATRR
jgi:hypothetical protein